MNNIEKLREIILGSSHAVFFGGAGVSTDSGIPDFRSSDGLYGDGRQSNEYYLSRECLDTEPEKFFDFYKANMVYPDAKPNKTHTSLAYLESAGVIKAVVTQNIDGLHESAGSRRVLPLHGTVQRGYCMDCREEYGLEHIMNGGDVPRCGLCGGVVRPDVTLYGEPLDGGVFSEAAYEISKADVLVVGGTSLRVYPAASLIDYFTGSHLIIVNKSATPYDRDAEYVCREPLSDLFRELIKCDLDAYLPE